MTMTTFEQVVGVGMRLVGPGAEMSGYNVETSDNQTEKELLRKRGGNACLSICA